MVILLKKTLRADEQDREDIKKQRTEWRDWSAEADRSHFIFIDESAAKTNIVPLRGWARGRCFGSCPGSWKTTTMLSFLKFDGSTDGLLIDGTADKETFREFMEEILLPKTSYGDIVIMDNARIHKKSFNVELFEKKGVKIKYLPPYSPDLNPIEKMWSKIKSILRLFQPRNFNEIWRRESEAHLDVTANDALGWYESCGYFH